VKLLTQSVGILEGNVPPIDDALEKVISAQPRDAGVVELFKKLSGADSLPGR
jgi:hypothetical protein